MQNLASARALQTESHVQSTSPYGGSTADLRAVQAAVAVDPAFLADGEPSPDLRLKTLARVMTAVEQQEVQFAVGLLLHFDFGSRDINFTNGMGLHGFMPARLGIVGTGRAPAVARVQQFLDRRNQNAAVTALGLPGTQAARLGPQLGSSQGNAQCFSCLSGSTGLAGQL